MGEEKKVIPPSGPRGEVAPLKYDEITVAAVQMNSKPVDPQNPGKGVKENLEHMLFLCDAAFCWPPGPVHLMAFGEFTLTGFDTIWTREDWLRIAIMVPGPETERIGQKAKELGCYIAFATHTQDAEWPGHFFNNSLIMSPDGNVIHTHWKSYLGFPGSYYMEYSTTVHDVLDEFVERYGWDAVWPVATTDIGNIATFTCSEGFYPETARAFAFNGAEILVRCTANNNYTYDIPGLGDLKVRMRSDCAASHLYGVWANGSPAIRLGGKDLIENAMGGGSMIIDPFGRIMQQAYDSREQAPQAIIPIAAFRAKHEIPMIRTEIYAPVLERHPTRFPPNMYLKYLPTDVEDAFRWSVKHARW